MAVLDCLAIVASLCLDQSANLELKRGTVWSGAKITIGDVEIISTASADSVITPYIPLMHRICDKKKCIFYKSYCDTQDGRCICTVWFTFYRDMYLRKLEISGPNTAVLDIKKRVNLVRAPNFMVPLSQLSLMSRDSSPPVCRSRSACSSLRR